MGEVSLVGSVDNQKRVAVGQSEKHDMKQFKMANGHTRLLYTTNANCWTIEGIVRFTDQTPLRAKEKKQSGQHQGIHQL